MLNAQTGEPVRKAQVTVIQAPAPQGNDTGPRYAITDASGRFSVSGLDPGRYRLDAQADRFAPLAYGAREPGRRGKVLALEPGQSLRDVTLHLVPCGVMAGTVRDENGDPVVGVSVQALPVGRIRFSQQGNQSQTNDLGEYRLYGLVPGSYIIQVTPQARPDQIDPPGMAYVDTFYPDTSDPAAATPLAVQPGSEMHEIDVDIRPVHAVRVRGRMFNANGTPAEGGFVMLVPRGRESRSPAAAVVRAYTPSRYNAGVQGTRGDFEIHDVPAGSYWAYGAVPGRNRQDQVRVALEVDDTDVEGLILTVGAGAELAGRVRVEPEKSFNYSALGLILRPEADAPNMGTAGAQVNANGTFVLHDVASGTYRVNVVGFPEEYYLKSARVGGADVLESGLIVDSAVNPGSAEIVLSSLGGSVSGAVSRDQQPAQATVFLVPDPPHRDRQDLYSSKRTKGDGTFSLLGLPPGDYKLFAFEDPDPELISDPSLFQAYEAKGEAVHIEAGHGQPVQLELIPAEDSR